MLTDLQACKDRRDLAHLLGVAPKELSYVLYVMSPALRYTPFCLSKKNGGTRQILAPHDRLKFIQKELLRVLYACEEDYTGNKSDNLSYGFKRHKGIVDNAYRHRRRRFVFNIDIEDFFDQFNFGRVRGFFIKDRRFALTADVATVIAQIVCFNNKLPQGSPTSPHIANLCSEFLDRRMSRFLAPLRCRYSRYADDITISTNVRIFPNLVAIQNSLDPQGWQVAPQLEDLLKRSGFSVAKKKTRLSSKATGRQVVTGLVVNEKVNITREYYLTTRAMCHRLFRAKPVAAPKPTTNYTNSCNPLVPSVDPDIHAHIEGRVAFIDHVRRRSDQRSLRDQQDEPTQFFGLLTKYFLHREFYGSPMPKVITEGPSDVFYLKVAARTTSKSLPQISVNGERKISFFKYGSRQSEVTGITGGCGSLKHFLYLFRKYSKDFTPSVPLQPVIMVIDNDPAGRDVLAAMNGMFGCKIDVKDKKGWGKVAHGLYVVWTPLKTKKTSCIEDFLPQVVLSTVLNGKTFSPDPKFDASKHYGKVALAKYVSDHINQISLTDFDVVLSAISECISDAI
jgi:RNA-directed DNA polymerase